MSSLTWACAPRLAYRERTCTPSRRSLIVCCRVLA